MRNITIDTTHCRVSQKHLTKTLQQLHEHNHVLTQALKLNYTTPYASINLPYDHTAIQTVTSLAKKKLALKPRALVCLGIGGSSLGTIAIIEAIKGKFYNNNHDIQFYCVETVDSDTTTHILNHIESILKNNDTVLLNVISKSGTTTETIANFKVFFNLIKKYHPHNYHEYIIATTDKNSALYTLSLKHNFSLLTIPTLVGGRYSLFSAVGLFPLMICGIDCKKLLDGAMHGAKISMENNNTNPASLSATILYNLYQKNYTTHDTFLFSHDLESIGKWYRQLLGESIGKEFDNTNKQVRIGINPTVSLGSNDLHSVGQLYLSGPYNITTTFISIEKNKSEIVVPQDAELHDLVPMTNGKTFSTIMNAILDGTTTAYAQNSRPFMTITLPEKSEYYIGQLLQIKMIEIMHLGFLFNINPFDQPNVELYKKETKNILTHTTT